MAHPYTSIEANQGLKGNFSMSPSYIDLLIDLRRTLMWYYSPTMWRDYVFPTSFINDFTRQCYFQQKDVYYTLLIAVFITLIRYAFESCISTLLISRLNLTETNKKKFPESAWKCFLYTFTWSYCFYLVRYRYDYFDQPYLIWDDWSPEMLIPFDIKLLYFVECGFYVHSIYATICMDLKRKDYLIMLVHHVLTIALISLSYCARYHKIGLLVFFMHDITDICLEATKLMRHVFVRQDGQKHHMWYHASHGSFVIFVVCWFIFRLYWFPLKVLYSSGVVFVYRALANDCGLHGLFNSLLWILLTLNLYWLYFILQIFYKVVTGSSSDGGDIRETDDEILSSTAHSDSVEEKKKKKKKKKKNT
ncbi:unnamed protein product [Rotaria magnacalcarata]|uniref:TLC domain-containing protein n=3 Tax=Rotaria magnacalcarata TaxID=392030 RepID=A0A816XIA3_9BILA|nr:unnamed protein product [Rotaria magnacalcarata]CAF1657086.1 unnamed protein product [Rotaria magnacalcarata]CAF2147034.1 unnamed protein product [Rotaria magnacalcarata]